MALVAMIRSAFAESVAASCAATCMLKNENPHNPATLPEIIWRRVRLAEETWGRLAFSIMSTSRAPILTQNTFRIPPLPKTQRWATHQGTECSTSPPATRSLLQDAGVRDEADRGITKRTGNFPKFGHAVLRLDRRRTQAAGAGHDKVPRIVDRNPYRRLIGLSSVRAHWPDIEQAADFGKEFLGAVLPLEKEGIRDHST